MQRVVVIGGGAAGMIAAATAAENGAEVILLEKNEKLGKKLYITGKGRCNITNNTDIAGLLAAVNTNPRFLHSAFYNFDAAAFMDFCEEKLGLPLKTERGGRVFPASDFSGDVNTAFEKYLRKTGVKIRLNSRVTAIKHDEKIFRVSAQNVSGQLLGNSEQLTEADAIIVATGGLSYPSTGSTGDGFRFAENFGHEITPTFPALVPLITAEKWVAELEGLSLKNVRCTAKSPDGKILYEETGEMLFTAKGVTGPLILSASAVLCDKIPAATLHIDLKPALSQEQLDARVLRDFAQSKNKNFANALDELLPRSMISAVVALSEIPPDKKVNEINRAERKNLVKLLKNLTLTPTETAGFREAVITKGGVSVREINPKTMMSKKIPGLFFAGEVIDTDAMTGGYNLQIAFSTGRLAGLSAAQRKEI